MTDSSVPLADQKSHISELHDEILSYICCFIGIGVSDDGPESPKCKFSLASITKQFKRVIGKKSSWKWNIYLFLDCPDYRKHKDGIRINNQHFSNEKAPLAIRQLLYVAPISIIYPIYDQGDWTIPDFVESDVEKCVVDELEKHKENLQIEVKQLWIQFGFSDFIDEKIRLLNLLTGVQELRLSWCIAGPSDDEYQHKIFSAVRQLGKLNIFSLTFFGDSVYGNDRLEFSDLCAALSGKSLEQLSLDSSNFIFDSESVAEICNCLKMGSLKKLYIGLTHRYYYTLNTDSNFTEFLQLLSHENLKQLQLLYVMYLANPATLQHDLQLLPDLADLKLVIQEGEWNLEKFNQFWPIIVDLLSHYVDRAPNLHIDLQFKLDQQEQCNEFYTSIGVSQSQFQISGDKLKFKLNQNLSIMVVILNCIG